MKRKLEHELIKWKNRKEHMPILLRGARQVGKSFLVEQFGKENFNDIAIIDFEKKPQLAQIFTTREPAEIISRIEFALKKTIRPGQTLLFLDEIQLCPEAILSLRYFKEEMADLHIIAAGSLLEFLLNDENFSFPVGRIEFYYLRPLSFLEYLAAASPFTYERIQQLDFVNPPNELEHDELLKLVRKYLFVGGMPAAIRTSLLEQSLFEAQRIHALILQAYESDFGKYAKHAQHKYLQTIFTKAPSLIGQVIKYSRIDCEIRSRELKPALDLLCYAGIFQRIYATTAAGLPLHAHMREDRFKLLYLDVGLLQTATKVDATLFFDHDILQINAGMLAEQFVGQELLAYSAQNRNDPLLYWERMNGGQAEVDFVSTFGSKTAAIEVKAGATGTLRSLHSFMEKRKDALSIRISEQPLSINHHILTVPFYLIGFLPKLVQQFLNR